jgi:predicted acetyltransferase
MLFLVEPSIQYKESFIAFLDENFEVDKINEKRYRYMKDNVEKYIEECLNSKVFKMYWYLDNSTNEFIGLINIAYQLDEVRQNYGGSCSYIIKPSKRNQGYGTTLLKTGLDKIKQMGHSYALIGCDVDNIGSTKVIENNGGIFEERLRPNNYPKDILRYKIKV